MNSKSIKCVYDYYLLSHDKGFKEMLEHNKKHESKIVHRNSVPGNTFGLIFENNLLRL